MVASSVSIGQTRPLAAIESSVHRDGGAPFSTCGGLGGWLQHHGADFVIADGGSASPTRQGGTASWRS